MDLEKMKLIELNTLEVREVDGGISLVSCLASAGCYVIMGSVGLGAFDLGYLLSSWRI